MRRERRGRELIFFAEELELVFDRINELEQLGLSLHYLTAATETKDFFKHLGIIETSGLFDTRFYRRRVHSLDKGMDPIAHYMIWGFRCYLDPSPDFSTAEYYLLNPDVRQTDSNPLAHYIMFGRREQRYLRISERDKKNSRIYSIPFGSKPAEEHAALECMKGAAYLCRYGFSLEKNYKLETCNPGGQRSGSARTSFPDRYSG